MTIMKKRITLSIITILIAITALVAPSLHYAVESAGYSSTVEQLSLFNTILSYLRVGYVEEVDTQDLIEGAIKGMLSKLDSHTLYLDPDQYKRLKADTRGSFGGLGIEITITPEDETLTVIAPIEGTPAFEEGIQPRDKIIEIDGESTEGIDIYDAVDKMRGEVGTDCILTIKRRGVSELLEFTITRAIIDLESLKYSYMLNDDIGYIKLIRFSEDSGYKIINALTDLREEGMKGLIFDLRGNPGGLLSMSVDVASIFLPGGTKVVYTLGRGELADKKEYYSFGGVRVEHDVVESSFMELPLIVLVDGSSASASEIVAGAIQDNERGLIIGEKTFGKASVQTVITLNEDSPQTSAFKMTIAKYYTPEGNLIEGEGISPDVEMEYPEYSPVVNSIYANGYFRVFAEELDYQYGDEAISRFRGMSDAKLIKDFKELLVEEDYQFFPEDYRKILPDDGIEFVEEEIDGQIPVVRRLIERELLRLVRGDEASFRFWQEEDEWIKRAISELSDIIASSSG